MASAAAVQAQFTYTTNNGTITITGYTGPGGTVTIPDSIADLPVGTIGDSAFSFYTTNLTNVIIGSNVTSIEDWAFELCLSLASVTIPNSVTNIGNGAFANCSSLSNVAVGTNVTVIGDSGLAFCTSLTSLTIPSSVTSIGVNAFSGCTNLTGVFFKGDAPNAGNAIFGLHSKATVYYVPGTAGWGSIFGGRPTAPGFSPVDLNTLVVFVDGVQVIGGTVDRVGSALISMSSGFGPTGEIYYTLDGSTPDFTGFPYIGPFTLAASAIIRAIAYNATYTDWAEAAPITANVEIETAFALASSTRGGGSIGVAPAPFSGANVYLSNTLVTLTATPSDGWVFLGWTGDSTATSNVITLMMNRPHNVQAVFGTSLSVSTNGSGQVLLNPPVGPYAFGSTLQLTAQPSPGYYFFGWAGAASGFASSVSLTITNPAEITSLFGRLRSNQVSLTLLPNGNGQVTVSPYQNVYTNGQIVELSASSYSNFDYFTNWSGDFSGTDNPVMLALTASMTITANFVHQQPPLAVSVSGQPAGTTVGVGGTVTLSGQAAGEGPFDYFWFNYDWFSTYGSYGSIQQITEQIQLQLEAASLYPHLGLPRGISGTSTLTLTNVSPADAGLYVMAAYGPGGAYGTATSSVAVFGLEMKLHEEQLLPSLVLDAGCYTSYRLEYSEDLSHQNWTLLAPVTMPSWPQTIRLYYMDTTATNHVKRFYRAVPGPIAVPPPTHLPGIPGPPLPPGLPPTAR